MINLSFNKRLFPSSYKVAKVILIHQKGDTQDSNNYRPISLYSNLSKMIEKLYSRKIIFLLTPK